MDSSDTSEQLKQLKEQFPTLPAEQQRCWRELAFVAFCLAGIGRGTPQADVQRFRTVDWPNSVLRHLRHARGGRSVLEILGFAIDLRPGPTYQMLIYLLQRGPIAQSEQLRVCRWLSAHPLHTAAEHAINFLAKAQALVQAGQLTDARGLLLTSANLLVGLNDHFEFARSTAQLVHVCELLNDSAQVRRSLEAIDNLAILTFEKEPSMRIQAASLAGKLGRVLDPDRVLGTKLQWLNKAVSLYGEDDTDAQGHMETILHLVDLFETHLPEYKVTEQLVSKALRMATVCENPLGQLRALQRLGALHSSKSTAADDKSALQFYQQALPLARSLGQKVREGQILGAMAALFRPLGLYAEGLVTAQEQYKHAVEAGDARLQWVAELNRASALFDLDRHQESVAVYQKVYTMAKAIKSREGMQASLQGEWAVHSDLKDKEKMRELEKRFKREFNFTISLPSAVGWHSKR